MRRTRASTSSIPRAAPRWSRYRGSGGSIGCIGLGLSGSSAAVEALEAKCKVPGEMLELPIGLQATDRFIDALRTMAGVEVPDSITDDRGRLLDMISDMHQYLQGKRVALFGDPDQLVSLTEFLNLLDMKPVYIVTGTPTPVTGAQFRSLTFASGERWAAMCRRRRFAPAHRPICTCCISGSSRNRWMC